MRRTLTVLACSTMLSTLALAADWSGALLDGACYDKQYQQLKDTAKAAEACTASAQTTTFALHSTGKVFKFDANGNSKAMAAVKNRADRLDPSKSLSATVNAKVEGTENAGIIKVENIEVQ
jgi:hypothetical protein